MFNSTCTTCGDSNITTGAMDLKEVLRKGGRKFIPVGTSRCGCPKHPVEVRIYRLGDKDYPDEQTNQVT